MSHVIQDLNAKYMWFLSACISNGATCRYSCAGKVGSCPADLIYLGYAKVIGAVEKSNTGRQLCVKQNMAQNILYRDSHRT